MRRVLLLVVGMFLLILMGSQSAYAGEIYQYYIPLYISNPYTRLDGARQVITQLEGSLQNPAWSPDGTNLLITRFRRGYNRGPADLFILNPISTIVRALVSDGSDNVNLPGAAWNSITNTIVFSSSRRPHDEIYIISAGSSPGGEIRITSRVDRMAYEPSLSPDGDWVVFESHLPDQERFGIIMKARLDGNGELLPLTPNGEDCRQPNWSPVGDRIVYQRYSGGQWDLWLVDSDGSNRQQLTVGSGDKTDASFSPDGNWVVFSGDYPDMEYANLFIVSIAGGTPIRLTNYAGYDGAPSWSPDDSMIVFESYPGDPDGKAGTTLWVIDVPSL